MTVIRWTFEDYWKSQTQQQYFYFIGGSATFTVPDGVYEIGVSLRGAPGGVAGTVQAATGGYVSGSIACNPGDVFTVSVGGAGAAPTGSTGAAGGFNHGGDGGNGKAGKLGGAGGGGFTALLSGADILAIAAGGGGSSGNSFTGGCGGASTGQTAAPVSIHSTGSPGQGGTQTAGGSGHNSGALGEGGDGAANTGGPGVGGGGGGYYGGGAGGVIGSDGSGGGLGGGGGSNFTGGFDASQPIQSTRGVLRYVGASLEAEGSAVITWPGQADIYTFEINPDDGGSLSIQKNMQISQNVGPNRVNIVQEGQSQAPTFAFSGAILTQTHLEALEKWYDRRTFIKIIDDLGREYYGVFSQFNPKRTRRASNFWYHTYDAQFTISAYKNASGDWVYGRVL